MKKETLTDSPSEEINFSKTQLICQKRKFIPKKIRNFGCKTSDNKVISLCHTKTASKQCF